jgi:ankyrin repeat protein
LSAGKRLHIGVNVDEIEEESGRNALMIAMDLNCWDAANLLLRQGASSVLRWYDRNDERWYKMNLLHEACYTGNLDQIKCLAEHEVEWAKKTFGGT